MEETERLALMQFVVTEMRRDWAETVPLSYGRLWHFMHEVLAVWADEKQEGTKA